MKFLHRTLFGHAPQTPLLSTFGMLTSMSYSLNRVLGFHDPSILSSRNPQQCFFKNSPPNRTATPPKPPTLQTLLFQSLFIDCSFYPPPFPSFTLFHSFFSPLSTFQFTSFSLPWASTRTKSIWFYAPWKLILPWPVAAVSLSLFFSLCSANKLLHFPTCFNSTLHHSLILYS